MKKLLLTVVTAAMLLTACSGGSKPANSNNTAAESDVIKIGGIIPQTGAASVYGVSAEKGIKLAVEEINAAGGVNGKQIEWISADDKADPTEAVTVYNKLVEEGVVGIIGPVTSKPAQAVADNSQEDLLPIITPTGTMASITEGVENVFRTCFTDPLQGQILANFAADKLAAKKVAVLRNTSNDYSNGVADAFIAQAQSKGLEVVADEGYGDGDVDFKVQLVNIQKASPDVIIIPEYYEKDTAIAKQIKELGITATLIGPDGWDGVLASVDSASVDTLEGVYFTNHYSVEDTSETVKNFVDAYRAKYNEDPSAFSALGYDTVYVYKAAIEQAGSTDSAAIIEALNNVDLQLVTGNLKFGENNNPVKSASIIKIVDGKYTFDSVVNPE